jgi:hypothetical protein
MQGQPAEQESSESARYRRFPMPICAFVLNSSRDSISVVNPLVGGVRKTEKPEFNLGSSFPASGVSGQRRMSRERPNASYRRPAGGARDDGSREPTDGKILEGVGTHTIMTAGGREAVTAVADVSTCP